MALATIYALAGIKAMLAWNGTPFDTLAIPLWDVPVAPSADVDECVIPSCRHMRKKW